MPFPIPDWFYSLDPIYQAFLGGIFTWGVTALGASLVFFTKKVNTTLLDSMMGFAAGVMIAARVSWWDIVRKRMVTVQMNRIKYIFGIRA